MINSYLHEIIPLKSVKKKNIKRQGLCTKAKHGKKIINNFINTHQDSKGSDTNIPV